MKTAYLFDFDYTLVDATEGIVKAFYYAFDHMGLKRTTREQVKTTVGWKLEEGYRMLTNDPSPENAKRFCQLYCEIADQTMTENTVFFPAAGEVLQTLKQRGMQVGIVTSKYAYRIEEALDVAKLRHFVDFVIGVGDVTHAKPDPEALYKALERLNVPKEQVLYTGDSVVDAATAKAAGIDFVGVSTGPCTKEELEAYPHVAVLSGLEEWRDLFLNK